MIDIFKTLGESKKPIGFTVTICLIVFSLLYLAKSFFFDVEGAVEAESKKQYSAISTEYLGKYLVDKYPGSKALLIYDSISSSPVIEERLKGVRKGLDGGIEIFKEIGLPENVPNDIPPRLIRSTDYIYADDFNRIMEKYPNADMIISLVGLPKDFPKMKIWHIDDPRDRPKLILFGGNPAKLHSAIEAGFIHALIIYRQMDKSVNRLPPEDIEEAFYRRFLLITPESLTKNNKK